MPSNVGTARGGAIYALTSLVGEHGVQRQFRMVSRAPVLHGNLVIVAGDAGPMVHPAPERCGRVAREEWCRANRPAMPKVAA